jgi:hypothetical protein
MLLARMIEAVKLRSERRRRLQLLEATIGPRYLDPADIRRFMRSSLRRA